MASFLMIVTLGLHGPIPPTLQDRMAMIAGAAVEWSAVHWIASVALSLYVVSGLILLTSHSRLTDGRWTLTAWAVVCVGCLWTMTTAVVETTVVTQAALSGSEEAFEAWWAFAEGKANGYAFFALAVAVIAGNEARLPTGATPPWAAGVAAIAGLGSFAGWTSGMWLGVAGGSILWVASSIVMTLWILWFGIALARTPGAAAVGKARSPGGSIARGAARGVPASSRP